MVGWESNALFSSRGSPAYLLCRAALWFSLDVSFLASDESAAVSDNFALGIFSLLVAKILAVAQKMWYGPSLRSKCRKVESVDSMPKPFAATDGCQM